MQTTAKVHFSQQQLVCEGAWNIPNIPQLEQSFKDITLPTQKEVIIDGSKITQMDTAGAWLLSQWINASKVPVKQINFSEKTQKLLELVQKNVVPLDQIPHNPTLPWIEQLGKNAVQQGQEFYAYLTFIGELSLEFLRIASHPTHIRWKALLSSIYKTGYNALPIISLLSLMIGIVLTYQMGVQLRNYGANIFIVDLLGLSVLREFGPLLTAIMVAGRTGSSFTAELGLMKTNQEINALTTMGVTPAELLLLPKIIGLFIALPLLTMWADIFGIIGGMIMAKNMLGINWYDFLYRFENQIPLRALLIGLGKAPIFALIISSIGCFQGISVKDTADSIGKNTTKSVVYSIFFIMVADAIFSVIFSKLKL